MIIVDLYSKDDCHLCEDARAVLESVQKEIPFTLRETKIIPGDEYFEEYKEMVPVVHINKMFAFKYRVNEGMFKFRLIQEQKDLARPTAEEDEANDSELMK
ncbi:MAG: glutaredoxin family protein [Bacteroidota bacterium]